MLFSRGHPFGQLPVSAEYRSVFSVSLLIFLVNIGKIKKEIFFKKVVAIPVFHSYKEMKKQKRRITMDLRRKKDTDEEIREELEEAIELSDEDLKMVVGGEGDTREYYSMNAEDIDRSIFGSLLSE